MSTLSQTVELQQYKPEFLKVLKGLTLPDGQAQYTAFPTDILENLIDRQYPIVILTNNEPVGFFLLQSTDRVKDFTDNPSALLLTALLINHSEQGKGFAKRAMNLIKCFVNQKFPEYSEIVLALTIKISLYKIYTKRLGSVTLAEGKSVR